MSLPRKGPAAELAEEVSDPGTTDIQESVIGVGRGRSVRAFRKRIFMEISANS